jgi:hypothetical protein
MQTEISEENLAAPPSHLISVPGSEWAFWRWVCLRSAGFPIEGVFKLAASPDLISAADEVTEALQAIERTRASASQDINSALEELRSSGRWGDRKTRKALLKARIVINAQELSGSLLEAGQLKSVDELAAAVRHLGAVRARFNEQFSKSLEQTTESIRWIAGLPLFREAISWQNRRLVKQVLDWFLRKTRESSSRNSLQRRNEEVIALYWQRYCTKNDTIGFFGPVGWARFVPDVECLVSRPGDQLVTARKTYWESWAIEALGTAILQKNDIQKWIAPILLPFIRIDGTVLHHPLFGAVPLTSKQALLLQACDGNDTARQIAERLLRSPTSGVHSENEVYQLLREFAARRFVFWSFNIPMGPYPEQSLRRALQRIGDMDLRLSAMASLEEFDSAKQRVDASAGNPERLDASLDGLEQVFERTTGLSATRNHGKNYAGKTLIYEDARRDVEVHLGPQLLQSLAPPLSLLLLAGRWFTAQVADLCRNKFREIYSQVQRKRDTSVEAAVLWAQTVPVFFEQKLKFVGPIQQEFQRKWERILGLGSGRETITYSYDELRPRVLKEFSVNRPGWIACHHSPDIMIAATSEEAIRKGDCLFVLGEAHIGKNTLEASSFVNQHPSPEELYDAIEHDLKHLNLVPLGLKETLGCRTTPSLIGKSAVRLEYLPDSFVDDRSKSIPISSLVVKDQGGELVASTRDGNYSLSVMDLLGRFLSDIYIDCFKIMSPRPHTPRILIDRLVIKRESWSFSPSELQFLQNSDPAESFRQIRSWARSHAIPRFIFYSVPVETKPVYLDLESPILTGIFARLVRRTQEAALPDSRVQVSEMLPTSDQLWLRDKHNQRYTSEFRMVAVDGRQAYGHRAPMGESLSIRSVENDE